VNQLWFIGHQAELMCGVVQIFKIHYLFIKWSESLLDRSFWRIMPDYGKAIVVINGNTACCWWQNLDHYLQHT